MSAKKEPIPCKAWAKTDKNGNITYMREDKRVVKIQPDGSRYSERVLSDEESRKIIFPGLNAQTYRIVEIGFREKDKKDFRYTHAVVSRFGFKH